jgi:hypothetical protein
MEEALKIIYERYGHWGNVTISFHDDGKGCAIYTNGIFNCSYEWD